MSKHGIKLMLMTGTIYKELHIRLSNIKISFNEFKTINLTGFITFFIDLIYNHLPEAIK